MRCAVRPALATSPGVPLVSSSALLPCSHAVCGVLY